MKLTQPAARPSRWQYRMWHAVTPAAYRYVYVLGNKKQRRERMKLLRLPILPYPKAGGPA